ncbi:hypothetical protein EVAR_24875_1 [Eumeta japonica]|uniref:Uncharacterized protein n=1 Tax=Eumeta variegata TaxID=151549 RepID=A0A4C1V596_EUMVA|nr:hypothetical protein EVAR_24875_1 [Eumeta japonica]
MQRKRNAIPICSTVLETSLKRRALECHRGPTLGRNGRDRTPWPLSGQSRCADLLTFVRSRVIPIDKTYTDLKWAQHYRRYLFNECYKVLLAFDRMRTGKRNRHRQPDSPDPNPKNKRDDISINQLT